MTADRIAQLLTSLKIDLGISISTTIYDVRLEAYLKEAHDEIEREGASLQEDSVSNNQLIVAFASWRWRTRDTGAGMPRALRYSLNNLIMSQKAGG